ncbi:equilibrative nucleoside transporter 3 [Trichonephila clavata]|uniref:Equilibrative nucleoside transporter 3 n=1 Tax=Trichonephila clavata TaxID=2740835 RepID=A0A8X6FB78_TRICU|nr:equilibrative nucleoside transporter 3 [Trichonephila clavata]
MQSDSDDNRVSEMQDALASQHVTHYQSTGIKEVTEGAPEDRYNVVRLTMYLFGITSLLPWNFFIQANDYWMYRFRNVSAPFDPTTEDKTHLQAIFSSYLAIASKVPYVIFLLVNAYISNKSSNGNNDGSYSDAFEHLTTVSNTFCSILEVPTLTSPITSQ